MVVNIKSALNIEDLNYRCSIGESNIEIQLLEDFLNIGSSEKGIEVLKRYVGKLNIVAIHTPLTKNYDVELNMLGNKRDMAIFIKTCDFANEVARIFNSDVIVVVHIGDSFTNILKSSSYMDIVRILKFCLNNYEGIKIAVENIFPLDTRNNTITGKNGFLNDNVLFVEDFISKYGFSERVGTVLDTCHAMITIKTYEYCKCDLSLTKFLEWNKSTALLLHLCNMWGNGYGVGNHGSHFSTDNTLDVKILSEFIEGYKNFDYTCPVSIEVYESNYLECNNYLTTKNALNSIMSSI